MKRKTIELFKEIAKLWEPRPPMTVSDWADKHRILTSESSSMPGQWRTDQVPYLRDIMDAVTDPKYTELAIMASAQVGKTELLLNAVGYFATQEPCPILYMLPDKALIKTQSKERLTPMINASPILKRTFAAAKGRSASNTIAKKDFPGGYVALVGANSATGLSSRPVRILIADEVDRFPVSAGREGDPINLGKKRTTTFPNKKHIFVSTPLEEDTSRINKLYQDSTQEQWCLSCPECRSLEALAFDNLKFERDEEGNVIKVEAACKSCGTISPESKWKSGNGQWVARKKHAYRRGFHLNQLVSPFVTWKSIVTEFLESKNDPEMLKTWTNTVMGETWQDISEALDEEELSERGEYYNADVPEGVKLLLATVDTQDNRFEIEVKGWGAGKESWGITYQVIYGDLKKPEVWKELDTFLLRTWKNAQGYSFPIVAVGMDQGGHFTGEVQRFCKERMARKVFAVRGVAKKDSAHVPLFAGYSENNPIRATVIQIGTDDGKYKVNADLKNLEYGPRYCHYPANRPDHDARGYTEIYFRQLTAEILVTKKKGGVIFKQWVQIRARNEALDLHVYQLALLEAINPQLDTMRPICRTGQSLPSAKVAQTKRRGTASSI